jgi:hypothetical protein
LVDNALHDFKDVSHMANTVRVAMMVGCVGIVFPMPSTWAQFPNWAAKPVRPRIDVIPPLGNNLPPSYAARFNRPSYLTGRIAYTIEPSSQEAMAWQRAVERGYYANHAPRMETHYMYPKPWEVLGVEAKTNPLKEGETADPPPEPIPAGPAILIPVSPVMKENISPQIELPTLVPREPITPRTTGESAAGLELAPTIDLPLIPQLK